MAVLPPWALPWVVLTFGVAPGAWAAIRTLVKVWDEHKKDRDTREDAREDREARDLAEARTALSKQQAEMFDRLHGEVTRCQGRLAEVERDRDRGWDIARAAYQRAHELRHIGLNAQHIAGLMAEKLNLPVPPWPDMALKPLEEFVPLHRLNT